jgi:hypothetical protein
MEDRIDHTENQNISSEKTSRNYDNYRRIVVIALVGLLLIIGSISLASDLNHYISSSLSSARRSLTAVISAPDRYYEYPGKKVIRVTSSTVPSLLQVTSVYLLNFLAYLIR